MIFRYHFGLASWPSRINLFYEFTACGSRSASNIIHPSGTVDRTFKLPTFHEDLDSSRGGIQGYYTKFQNRIPGKHFFEITTSGLVMDSKFWRQPFRTADFRVLSAKPTRSLLEGVRVMGPEVYIAVVDYFVVYHRGR